MTFCLSLYGFPSLRMRRVASRRQFESPPIAEMAHPTHPIAQTRRSGRGGVRRPGAIRGDRGRIATLPVRWERTIRWSVSSPLGRGKSVLYDLYRLGDRSIPTCAGEPPSAYRQTTLPLVNPRMCGGAANYRADGTPMSGQSPHVRGSRQRVNVILARGGSIPACAGEPLGNSLSDQTTDRLWAGRRVRSCLDPIIEKGEVITGQTHVDGLTVYARTTPSPCIFSAINAGAKGRWPALSLLT